MATPPAPLQTFGFVSKDAQIALTEFTYDFLESYKTQPTPWADKLGLVRSSQFLRTRWPMPVSAPEFQHWMGEINYRKLSHKTLEVITDAWSDGVEELARIIEAPDFLGWMNDPAAQAEDAAVMPNRIVAGLLAAGASARSWENPDNVNTVKFFDLHHPANPFDASAGDYPNLYPDMPLTFDNVRLIRAAFRKLPAPNGVEKRGSRLTDILVHPDQEQSVMELRRDKYIMRPSLDATGAQVGYMFAPNENATEDDYAFNVWVGEHLTESGVWYPMGLNKAWNKPWVIQRRMVPSGVGMPSGSDQGSAPSAGGMFEVIVNDKSSQRYKDTGYVSIAHKIELGIALAHPWAISRCEPT